MKNSKNQIFIITATGILVFVAVFAGILLTRNAGKSTKTINTESAISVIERYVKKIDPRQAEVIKSPVELTDSHVDVCSSDLTLTPIPLPCSRIPACMQRFFPLPKNAGRERTGGSMRWQKALTDQGLR